jgi:hypothetical protein
LVLILALQLKPLMELRLARQLVVLYRVPQVLRSALMLVLLLRVLDVLQSDQVPDKMLRLVWPWL